MERLPIAVLHREQRARMNQSLLVPPLDDLILDRPQILVNDNFLLLSLSSQRTRDNCEIRETQSIVTQSIYIIL